MRYLIVLMDPNSSICPQGLLKLENLDLSGARKRIEDVILQNNKMGDGFRATFNHGAIAVCASWHLGSTPFAGGVSSSMHEKLKRDTYRSRFLRTTASTFDLLDNTTRA